MAFKRFYFTLQYADYWTKRFPRLLIHAWYTMHCVKREPAFIKYFDKDFDFVQVKAATITVVLIRVFQGFNVAQAPLKLSLHLSTNFVLSALFPNAWSLFGVLIIKAAKP